MIPVESFAYIVMTLEYIRDETKTVNESTFQRVLDIHLPDHVDESDANLADWKYKFISK